MSDAAAALLHDLAVKGFLPLVFIGAVLFGAYTLFDRAFDTIDARNRFVEAEVAKALHELHGRMSAVETACKPEGTKR